MKTEFEARNFGPNLSFIKDGISSLEEAFKLLKFKNQCTFEEAEVNSNGYSHIIEYKDDECYNDLYFI